MRDATPDLILLDWYDQNARVMPWRVSPQEGKAGRAPDPYRIWLSEVMLQQTTVVTVGEYFKRFTKRWPDVVALANAADEDVLAEWAGLGYYARARNLIKCARVVAFELGGQFPKSKAELEQLPGIGPYTSSAIAAIAYDHQETVVDGNVERVIARMYNITTPLPAAKPEITDRAARLTPKERPGDYAQAIMDLGATVCTPRSPSCEICPWQHLCLGRSAGVAADLPRKTPKKPKPVRRGHAYVVRRSDGAWLLERRPDKGLLGGMLGWPGSHWETEPTHLPPLKANWQHAGEVKHTFTHFHLLLDIHVASVADGVDAQGGIFLTQDQFRPSDLPTVMRKAFDVAAHHHETAIKSDGTGRAE